MNEEVIIASILDRLCYGIVLDSDNTSVYKYVIIYADRVKFVVNK